MSGTVASRERTVMAIPSPGYSITIRVELPVATNSTAALTTAVASSGGVLTALDVAESRTDRLVVDVTCDTRDEAHGQLITGAVAAVPGAVGAYRPARQPSRTPLAPLRAALAARRRVALAITRVSVEPTCFVAAGEGGGVAVTLAEGTDFSGVF